MHCFRTRASSGCVGDGAAAAGADVQRPVPGGRGPSSAELPPLSVCRQDWSFVVFEWWCQNLVFISEIWQLIGWGVYVQIIGS